MDISVSLTEVDIKILVGLIDDIVSSIQKDRAKCDFHLALKALSINSVDALECLDALVVLRGKLDVD